MEFLDYFKQVQDDEELKDLIADMMFDFSLQK